MKEGIPTFRADITSLCKEEGENLLVVAAAMNTKTVYILSQQTLLFTADFTEA